MTSVKAGTFAPLDSWLSYALDFGESQYSPATPTVPQPSPLTATSFTWVGGSGGTGIGNWDIAANWSTGAVPVQYQDDLVYINQGTCNIVGADIDEGSAYLEIGEGAVLATYSADLIVYGNADIYGTMLLSSSGTSQVAAAGVTGILTVYDGGCLTNEGGTNNVNAYLDLDGGEILMDGGTLVLADSGILNGSLAAASGSGGVLELTDGTYEISSSQSCGLAVGLVLAEADYGPGILSIGTGIDFTFAGQVGLGYESGVGQPAIVGAGTFTTTDTSTILGAIQLENSITWVNSGLAEDEAGLGFNPDTGSTVTVLNAQGGTFDFTSSASALDVSSGDNSGCELVNEGTLATTSSLASASATSNVNVDNGSTGAIDIGYGTFVLNGLLSGLGTLSVSTGAKLDVNSASSFEGSTKNAGFVSVNDQYGTISFLGAVRNTGTISAVAGTLAIASEVTGSGTIDITSALSLSIGTDSAQTVDFVSASASSLLVLADPADMNGSIAGFAGSNEIELLNTVANGATFTSSGDLRVTENGALVVKLVFDGSYTSADFSVSSIGSNTFINYV